MLMSASRASWTSITLTMWRSSLVRWSTWRKFWCRFQIEYLPGGVTQSQLGVECGVDCRHRYCALLLLLLVLLVAAPHRIASHRIASHHMTTTLQSGANQNKAEQSQAIQQRQARTPVAALLPEHEKSARTRTSLRFSSRAR